MVTEKVRLESGSLARAVSITGQAYQDPKDVLDEFISNAADECAALGVTCERIRIVLQRKGRYPLVAVDDDGKGTSPDRVWGTWPDPSLVAHGRLRAVGSRTRSSSRPQRDDTAT
jgi:C4-dicarboxylate-specific signal transduction histidine kinase